MTGALHTIRAVIFDCDGVLVDSERLAGPILAELLTDLGLPTTQVDVDRDFEGRSWWTWPRRHGC